MRSEAKGQHLASASQHTGHNRKSMGGYTGGGRVGQRGTTGGGRWNKHRGEGNKGCSPEITEEENTQAVWEKGKRESPIPSLRRRKRGAFHPLPVFIWAISEA